MSSTPSGSEDERRYLVMVIVGQEVFAAQPELEQQRLADSVPPRNTYSDRIDGSDLLLASSDSDFWNALPERVRTAALPVFARRVHNAKDATDRSEYHSRIIELAGQFEKGWIESSHDPEYTYCSITLRSPRFIVNFFEDALGLFDLTKAKEFFVHSLNDDVKTKSLSRFNRWLVFNDSHANVVEATFEHGRLQWSHDLNRSRLGDDITAANRTQYGHEQQITYEFTRFDWEEVRSWLEAVVTLDDAALTSLKGFIDHVGLPQGKALPPADLSIGLV